MADVYIALVHHPVYNKNRAVIASALTTIDMHDLARLAATYGMAGFYVVTPLKDQRALAEEMIEHWCRGWGAGYNSNRAEALNLVRLADSLAEAKEAIDGETGREALLVSTSALDGPERLGFEDVRKILDAERPVLIVFGTAWGLTEQAQALCEIKLEPIKGPTKYNHLSVRSAAGIVLDRLMGRN